MSYLYTCTYIHVCRVLNEFISVRQTYVSPPPQKKKNPKKINKSDLLCTSLIKHITLLVCAECLLLKINTDWKRGNREEARVFFVVESFAITLRGIGIGNTNTLCISGRSYSCT